MPVNFIQHPSSYRDPSGFIFTKEEVIYRQVNKSFKEDFDLFINSGCYDKLVKKLLLPHENISGNLTGDNAWYMTLKPEKLSYISYPYEWCFDMLKDAALLSLSILKEALASGLVLKDATPYNIQWHKGKLIFIDTLSFEKYEETKPWVAYRQFCENFLSPLLLAHYSKMPVQELLLAYSEGIPLPLTSSLLPWRSKFSLHVYLHIHLNAKYSLKDNSAPGKQQSFSKQKMQNLVTSLEVLITKLKLPVNKTTWSHYYDEASQRTGYLEEKQQIIQRWLQEIKPGL